MTVIAGQGDCWHVSAPQPVGPPETLLQRLAELAGDEAVALGIDCPIGLPRAYAQLHATAADFPSFLRALPETGAFWQAAASVDEILPGRPFYPARGMRGMTRLSHARALGLADAASLSRACDRATSERPAGAPLFWTLGANQSGKAAIAAWRDVLCPALRAPRPPRLWPFEGGFCSLLGRGEMVVAETYPAEALRQLGLVPAGSKRRPADRAAYAPGLRLAMSRLDVVGEAAAEAMIDTGFGADAAAEDRFDSFLGALCVLSVAIGQRVDFVPPDPLIRQWEGWVLGQTAMPAIM
jgi:hypothetical protein